MSTKVYTEEDIYEGMVLECVESRYDNWTFGKQYIVENGEIKDDDGDSRGTLDIIVYLNDHKNLIYDLTFKVVEPEEEHQVLQLFNYTFGLKTGDVETINCYLGNQQMMLKHEFNKKHITIPAYDMQQAIEYLTNKLEYDIYDIVSMEVK